MNLFRRIRIVCLASLIFSLGFFTNVKASSKYTKIDTLKGYTSTSVDLNGDGVKEKIKLKLNVDADYFGEYSLYINNRVVTNYCEAIEGNFRIVDINPKDKYKEIAIQEYGPSDDYSMTFYSYDGKKITSVGTLYGYGTSLNGTGSVFTNSRGAILCTWFYKNYYKLSSKHVLTRVPQKLYTMNLKATVKIPISLKTSQTNSKVKVTLKKGEKVTIVSTDGKRWCLVKNSKGVKGWFSVKNFYYIEGTRYTADQVFGGLPYYD
jgi:hypothetical protein